MQQRPFATAPNGAPTPQPSSGRSRSLLIGLCGLALLVGGFLFGRSLNNDSQATVERSGAVTAVQLDDESSTSSAASAADADADAATDDESNVVAPLAIGEGDEEPIVAVAKAVSPSVVLITTADGQGSGIVYDASGLIITNAHVVAGVQDVTVMMPDGRRVPATVVGADPATDIAMVQIDRAVLDAELAPVLTPAVFAPTSSIEVGQLSVAIGSPFGLDQTVTAGIISAVNRPVSSGQAPTQFFVQTDAPINPGNSGGALADRQGRVIGMNTLIRTNGAAQGNVGVGFAIPADTMQFVAERLIVGEEVQHSFLGIQGSNPVVGDPGAVITAIIPGFPAEAAGLRIDDRIVEFNGKEITDMGQLAATVRLSPQNLPIEVAVVRDGELVTVDLELAPADQ